MSPDAFVFHVDDAPLVGLLHPGMPEARTGVLIIVGGPQYRVGSHRQFLLLARDLSAQGIPVMRFDYRGMGDSGGQARDFQHVDEDIKAALDAFQSRCPALERIVLWGLCDAASAALLYAWRDTRVSGLVLLNPWVRTEEGLARAYMKQYYLKRLASPAFWKSLLSGGVRLGASLRGFVDMLRRAWPGPAKAKPAQTAEVDQTQDRGLPKGPLPERMAQGWKRFQGPILLILSGDDLTAAEFRDCAAQTPSWRGLLQQDRVTVEELPEANHTFSRRAWRDRVSELTCHWLST